MVKTIQPILLQRSVTCDGCGERFNIVPIGAMIFSKGIVWDCSCGMEHGTPLENTSEYDQTLINLFREKPSYAAE